MKKLLLILSLVLLSFSANAISVEHLYSDCKPVKSNGFGSEALTKKQMDSARFCMTYFLGMAEQGYRNCITLDTLLKINKENLSSRVLKILKYNANSNPQVNPNNLKVIITTFINFAENNSDKWGEPVIAHSEKFLSSKFPCLLPLKSNQ